MIGFLHFHKAAGTSVVNAAIASGLRLPDGHANGHPLSETGGMLTFCDKTAEQVGAILDDFEFQGIECFAMEWDFVHQSALAALRKTRLVTVLRDPLARAISNFRMDVVNHWCGDMCFGLATYLDQSETFRSNNYYTRLLCSLAPSVAVTVDHVQYAIGGTEHV